MKRSVVYAFILLVSAACGDDGDSNGPAADGGQETVIPLDPAELSVEEMLDTALQGEFLAEETYRQVVEDFGAVQPFSAIVTAEVQHSDAFVGLYEVRGLSVPASEWDSDNVPRYDSLHDACAAGQVLEEATVARYDTYLAVGVPPDVERVFTNLRNASRDNHLPAFERCFRAESDRPVP